MKHYIDGPATDRFAPVTLAGNVSPAQLKAPKLAEDMHAALTEHGPAGRCVCQGIAFEVGRKVVFAKDTPVVVPLKPTRAGWFVFLHATDRPALQNAARRGFAAQQKAMARIHEVLANYVLVYDDGTEARATIRRKHQLGSYRSGWGSPCVEAAAFRKQHPVRAHHEQNARGWGWSQTRVAQPDGGAWVSWVWAWRNPKPGKRVKAFRIEPRGVPIVLSAVSAGNASDTPIRWRTRRKAVLTLPAGTEWDGMLGPDGLYEQIQLDLGQVISAEPRALYPVAGWPRTCNNKSPEHSKREILVEYAAHPDAQFHLPGGKTVAVAAVEKETRRGGLRAVAPASQRVRLRVVEKGSNAPVAVKLHVHGTEGEYLAPEDRHRVPNDAWFEDYSTDFVHRGGHRCTYIPGETVLKLPLGTVYIEVAKGYEIRPVRTTARITRATRDITLTVERVLRWRSRGWVSADTHVHFLSPQTAHLEGAAEGVNVVNLLASQWGELMTNVGDFDGRTTIGSKEAGGDGEYLVRVGSENRQHVLGHISLLGYNPPIIAPMTTGGPDESAIGDPVETLLTEWAAQCRKQDGVVVIPHFPWPRMEHAATIVSGQADGVEMTAWGDLYSGIDANSLADWYRYLNCGYFVAAVGGTDKMSANTAIGTVRTYARIPKNRSFTYEQWKGAIRRGETFVTYGPLMEFSVDGKVSGERISMSRTGGTVDVVWDAASVTVPMTSVELVVNGEVRERTAVKPWEAKGHWRVNVARSSWLALLIRGQQKQRREMIAAHSSPVMVNVKGTEFYTAADAMTILQQIEGSLAYLDAFSTRAEASAYRRMRLVLTSAHRALHNRMHRHGHYHEHTPATDHKEHHG